MWLYFVLAIIGFFTITFYALGLHHKPQYIHNFEEEEFGRGDPFVKPYSINHGLAVYCTGDGEPLLLFPYPHSHTAQPIAQTPLAEIFTGIGRRVVTFDPPGAYQSIRAPTGSMSEMIDCAGETLERLGFQDPVDVVGHSMAGLCALAYAIEHPESIHRLVLATSLSGFPAAARWGLPGSAFRIHEADYWRIILWGIKLNAGRGSLALHKKLSNLMKRISYCNKKYFIPIEIEADDYRKGVPIRTIWSKNMYKRLSFADRLAEVHAPTLILAGRHDPQAPLACSEELLRGIPQAKLVTFEYSGHFPFIEETSLFTEIVDDFLCAIVE